jgi:AcrR family transcriptional regulator
VPLETASPAPRTRILDSASEAFYRRGIAAVGVDAIVADAGVAKSTLYRHFPSKDDLIVAFLRRRDERWRAWLRTEVERHPGPAARARAVAAAILDHPRPREDR